MTLYSVQLRDRVFLKGWKFLSFAKNMSKFVGNNKNKSLSSKYR